MDVFNCKRNKFVKNSFVFPVLEWVSVVLDLELNKDAFDGSDFDAAAASTPDLITALPFFSLLMNECLAKVG